MNSFYELVSKDMMTKFLFYIRGYIKEHSIRDNWNDWCANTIQLLYVFTSVIFKAHVTNSLSECDGSDLLHIEQKGAMIDIIDYHRIRIDLEENLLCHRRFHL